MKKRVKKLALNRETVRRLSPEVMDGIAGADDDSIQGGETCCWCTGTCDTCHPDGCGKTVFRVAL